MKAAPIQLAPFFNYDDPNNPKFSIRNHHLDDQTVKALALVLPYILDINEVGQIFGNQFNLYMSWYDFRLKLHNMKSNINMNTLTNTEKEGIWVPSLVFSNTEAKVNTVNDPKAFAVARWNNLEYLHVNESLPAMHKRAKLP